MWRKIKFLVFLFVCLFVGNKSFVSNANSLSQSGNKTTYEGFLAYVLLDLKEKQMSLLAEMNQSKAPQEQRLLNFLDTIKKQCYIQFDKHYKDFDLLFQQNVCVDKKAYVIKIKKAYDLHLECASRQKIILEMLVTAPSEAHAKGLEKLMEKYFSDPEKFVSQTQQRIMFSEILKFHITSKKCPLEINKKTQSDGQTDEVDSRDPIMVKAIAEAKSKINLFLKLYKKNPNYSFVKFSYKNSLDRIENIWAQVGTKKGKKLNVIIVTKPINPKKDFDLNTTIGLEEVIDWEVQTDHGYNLGGFTYFAIHKMKKISGEKIHKSLTDKIKLYQNEKLNNIK